MLGLVCSDPGPVPQQFCSACHLYLGSNGMIMIWPGRNHNPYQETIKLSGVFGVVPRTRHSGLYITNTLWSGNSTPAVSESWSVHIPHKVCCTKLPIQFEKNPENGSNCWLCLPLHLHNIPITIGFKPHSPGEIPGFR